MAGSSRRNISETYRGVREFVRQAFVTGAAVTIPFVLTLIVLGFVVNFVSQQLNPIVGIVTTSTSLEPTSGIAVKGITIVTLLSAMFLIGAVAEWRPDKSGFDGSLEGFVSRIPGVGSLYRSFNEMSHLLLDSDSDIFQEVKLVEFPEQGSYSIAFLTAETPDVVKEATEYENMVTVFLPMAPNPVTGGHVLHVSADRVHDVDISVEEGIHVILTSGVVTNYEKNGM